MNILIAVDSFKGSISSLEIADIAIEVLKDKGHQVVTVPVSDGGEHFLDVMKTYVEGDEVQCLSYEPSGNMIQARYLFDDKEAYIALDSIAGIEVTNHLNPRLNTTYGVGLAIKDAISRGSRKVILGVGGSTTNDGGAGMLQAMGCDFFDENDMVMTKQMNGDMIGEVHRFDAWLIDQLISGTKFVVACDVKNPLLGEQGCARVYAKQKGASDQDVDILEKNMTQFAHVVEAHYKKDYSEEPGAGAAGGVGFGALALLKAKLVNGIDLIAELSDLETKIMDADVVIVGEGTLDTQSDFGKAPIAIAKLAKQHDKRVIGIFGMSELDKHESLNEIHTIVPQYANQETAINHAGKYIKKVLENLMLD